MQVTLNWTKIAELGSPENYKVWCDSKKISYTEVLTTVEKSPSLEGPIHSTLRIHVGKNVYSFYLYAVMPVIATKALEDWM